MANLYLTNLISVVANRDLPEINKEAGDDLCETDSEILSLLGNCIYSLNINNIFSVESLESIINDEFGKIFNEKLLVESFDVKYFTLKPYEKINNIEVKLALNYLEQQLKLKNKDYFVAVVFYFTKDNQILKIEDALKTLGE